MRSVFIFFTFFASVACAQLKIAVIDMDFAIQATTDGKNAKLKLGKEFKAIEAKVKSSELTLRKKAKKFEKKAMILSEKKRSQQQQELQKIAFEMQKEIETMRKNLQQKQRNITKPIIEKMERNLAQLAKENGYDIVLNKSVNNVLWAKKQIDITQLAIKKYEKSS